MDGRIGTLHVRYHVPPGSTTAAALAPGFDRAIGARLGDAVAERLSLVLGADPSVIVIRELKTRVALDRRDLMLDARVIERISRASVDAITDLLHGADTPEHVMRFADQAEFIGSFILDLLQGTAWDRWYFGAFQSYRRGAVRESIAAILADHQTECARVFAWLARRGRLSDVMTIIGSAEARRFASGAGMSGADATAQADIEPLIQAAFALVQALGWPVTDGHDRRRVLAGFFSGTALPPSWSDRRALSEWVLECARAIVAAFLRAGERRPQPQTTDMVQALLAGPLDWLDGAWLSEQWQQLRDDRGGEFHGRRGPRLLAARHERMLARLARRIADRRVRFDPSHDRDALVVRLVAAISEETDDSAPLDRALIAAIERIADAWQSASTTEAGPAALARLSAAPHARSVASASSAGRELTSRVDAVAAAGAAALDVLRALAGVTVSAGELGDPTEFAGLYLVTRALLDVRLSALAREADVPFDQLRVALATYWFAVSAPFDKPTTLWLNTDSGNLAALCEPGVGLADLDRSLTATLLDQRAIDMTPPEDGDAVAPSAALIARGCPAEQAATIARIAWMVMRAWSRWLPGIAEASPAFLIARGLTRAGHVRVSESRIDVALEPAPLDVVLEMAGYYKPIASVTWLGGRKVVFAIHHALES